MGVILEFNVKNAADFVDEGLSAGLLVVAVHIVAPVDFVNFASGGAGRGSFEVARERKHGDIAGVLVETDNHNGVSELSSVVGATVFVAFHVVTTSTKSENVGAAVLVGLERFVSILLEDEVKDIALTAGDFGDDVIAPDDKDDAGDEKKAENTYDNTGDDFAFFTNGFFLFFHFFAFVI